MKRLLSIALLLMPGVVLAAPGFDVLTVQTNADGGQSYSMTLQVLVLMTLLSFLPAMLLMMTSFARIIIVLALLRQAMGTMSTPTNQILIGLALFLTFFVMKPVLDQAYTRAVEPYMNEQMAPDTALQEVLVPFRHFMMNQVRETDLALFGDLAGEEDQDYQAETIPMSVLVPAFITSELKTAFQIGFMIFIPFLIIDLVVASVLMAMGMMMLSPLIVSLPFKIMLFVIVDGWVLIVGTLASSFYA